MRATLAAKEDEVEDEGMAVLHKRQTLLVVRGTRVRGVSARASILRGGLAASRPDLVWDKISTQS